MERGHHLRPHKHPRAALFRRGEQKPQIPPPARRGRGPDQVPANLRQMRQGSHLGRHRQGLRVLERSVRHLHRGGARLSRPGLDQGHRRRHVRAARRHRSDLLQQDLLRRPRDLGIEGLPSPGRRAGSRGPGGRRESGVAGQGAPRHRSTQGRRLRPRDHALARRDREPRSSRSWARRSRSAMPRSRWPGN